MNTSVNTLTVKDLSYLINYSGLRAAGETSLEKLADLLCCSDRCKIYLEDENGRLCGVVQARLIAGKILRYVRQNEKDQTDLLPAITYVLNAQRGIDIAEPAISVCFENQVEEVLHLMERNNIREIAVTDEDGHFLGTLEAKNILTHYLRLRAEATL